MVSNILLQIIANFHCFWSNITVDNVGPIFCFKLLPNFVVLLRRKKLIEDSFRLVLDKYHITFET